MLKFNDYLKEAALSAKQKKIAAVAGDKDKIDAADLAALRAGKKPVEEASCSSNMKKEELVGNQHKLDKNKNGKLDAHDFKLLRKEAKDGWSKNDSLAKPITSSQAMADHSKYFNKVTKLDPKTGEPIKKDVKEEVEINEGKMKDIYTDMMHHATKKGYSSHKEFTSADYDIVGKQHGISGKELAVIAGHKTAQQADTHFKKPVEPGKGMDRAKALAQRGMQSLSKEEVERIEEKLTQIDELSKKTLGSYAHKATDDAQDKAHDAYDSGNPTRHELEIQGGKNNDGKYNDKPLQNRLTGIARASKKLGDKGIGKDVEKSVAHHLKQRYHYDNMDDGKAARSDDAALRQSSKAHEKIQKVSGVKEEIEQIDELSKNTLGSYVKRSANQAIIKSLANPKDDSDDMKTIAKREKGINLATSKLAKEEVSAEMSPYLKATLKVMDEGKIDNLRDAQKLRRDTQSAYEKDYKPDTSHPHIQVVKGTAYGGENQKDDEGDEKPDETKEKKGRGRPTGSKSGARQKGGGHEDGGIPVHNLNLPKSYK